MKKLVSILALVMGASVFAADAANDALVMQRNSANDDNVQRNVTATANSLFAFDASLIPTSTAAPILASVQANASAGLLLKNFSGTTVMTVGPGSGTGVAFNASGLTSVNTVTAADSTALTLTGGSSGASLVLGQGPTNASVALTALGSSDMTFAASAGSLTLNSARTAAQGATAILNNTTTNGPLFQFRKSGSRVGDIGASGNYLGSTAADFLIGAQTNLVLYTNFSGTESARLTTTGNLLIGTTTDMTGSGGLKVAGTTASTGVGTGALQVAGGIYAGAARWFGSTATFAGAVTHTLGTNLPPQTAPASPASGWVLYTDSGDGNKLKAKASTGTVVTIGTP